MNTRILPLLGLLSVLAWCFAKGYSSMTDTLNVRPFPYSSPFSTWQSEEIWRERIGTLDYYLYLIEQAMIDPAHRVRSIQLCVPKEMAFALAHEVDKVPSWTRILQWDETDNEKRYLTVFSDTR